MIAALLLLFAQADSDAPVVQRGTDVAFNCGDPDNNDAEIAACEAEEAECADPQTQQQMNYCASQDFWAADQALNEQWALTVATMKEADAELPQGGDGQPGYYEILLEAQRAWLKYRDGECLSESFYARGGSLQPLLEAQCRTYLTQLRTEQLRSLAAEPDL